MNLGIHTTSFESLTSFTGITTVVGGTIKVLGNTTFVDKLSEKGYLPLSAMIFGALLGLAGAVITSGDLFAGLWQGGEAGAAAVGIHQTAKHLIGKFDKKDDVPAEGGSG